MILGSEVCGGPESGSCVIAHWCQWGKMDAVPDTAADPLPSWHQPTAQVASGMVFTDEAGSILLVKPTYNEVWHLPGGVVEAGESPAAGPSER